MEEESILTTEKITLSQLENFLFKSADILCGNMYNSAKLQSLETLLMQDLLTGKKRITLLLNDTEVMNAWVQTKHPRIKNSMNLTM